jgi:valyl-tRNA synthetase
MERQEPGRAMGREKFIERVWQWKAESGGIIVNQLKRLGASCDWSRERFTMDEGLSRAVVKVFVELHREGLIYKDKRLVNWDPEAADRDFRSRGAAGRGQGQPLVHRYPLEGKTMTIPQASSSSPPRGRRRCSAIPRSRCIRTMSATSIWSASTRSCRWSAAAHPDHRRRLFRSGKRLGRGQDHAGARLQRFRGRQPAQSAADQRARSGRRISRSGNEPTICAAAGRLGAARGRIERRRSLRRAQADRRARLEDFGFLERIEPNTHMVPHGDRSGVVLEPYLTDQWYVDAKTMAQPAIAAVRGATASSCRRMGKNLFRVDGEHPALVHLPPALVGPSDSGLVRAGRQGLRRRDRR